MKNLYTIICLSLIASCATPVKTTYEAPSDSSHIVSLWPSWTSVTKEGLTAKLNLRNNSAGKLILNIADISCMNGNVQGTMSRLGHDLPAFQRYIDTDHKKVDYISLERGETKSSEVLCSLSSAESIKYSFVIKQVYLNPTGDGQTKGDIAQEAITWSNDSL